MKKLILLSLVCLPLQACFPAPVTPAVQAVIDARYDRCIAAGGSINMCVDYAMEGEA